MSQTKYLSASLIVAVVVASSSVLLTGQPPPPVLAASKGSSLAIPVSLTTAPNITVSVNNVTRSYAEQIMAYCEGDTHCPVLMLDKLPVLGHFRLNETMSRQVVLGTFSDLVMLYHERYDECHDVGHHLGRWLYGYTRDLEEALSYAQPQVCGGAVYHGIFQAYFVPEQIHTIGGNQTEQHIHNVDKNQTEHVNNVDKNQLMITNLCPVSEENINWYWDSECIHGIGHGLTTLYNYNTTAAVDRCNEFEPQWAQNACSRGVFMENVIRYLESGEGNFNKNDLYYPCDATVEKFVPQCYYYHALYLFVRNGMNITETFAQCDNISPSEFARYCYGGVAVSIFNSISNNTELAIATCHLGSQSNYHSDCLRAMVRNVLNQDAKQDRGFEFCSLSMADFKAECYEMMGMWIKAALHANQQELERECSKARDIEYVTNCINANPDPRMQSSLFEA
jgi:hypothetical protein